MTINKKATQGCIIKRNYGTSKRRQEDMLRNLYSVGSKIVFCFIESSENWLY